MQFSPVLFYAHIKRQDPENEDTVFVSFPPFNPTHRTLQYLGDSLPLFHHVEVLPEVRRHVSFTDVVRVIFIDAVKISLFVRHAGGWRGCDHPLAGLNTHASIWITPFT